MGGEPLPYPGENLIQGRLAAHVVKERLRLARPIPNARSWWCQRRRGHEIFLISPTTLPSTLTSRLRIGSINEFSGCRRT